MPILIPSSLRRLVSGILLTLLPMVAWGLSFNPSSVLSDGRWVKVRVDTTGVYRLSNASLAAMGFADPFKVSVSGYGSVERAHSLDTAPDDLPPVAVMRTADAIYFYAEGAARLVPNASKTLPEEHINRFSSGSYYFITDRPGIISPEIETIPYAEPEGYGDDEPAVVTSHLSIDRRRYHRDTPQHSGVLTYSPAIDVIHPSITERWSLADCVSKPVFVYRYVGLPYDQSRYSPRITFGQGVKADAVGSHTGIRGTTSPNVVYVASGHNQYDVSTHPGHLEVTFSDPEDDFGYLALEHMTLRCERSNNLATLPALWDLYNVWPEEIMEMYGAPEGLVVWDVTIPRTPVSLGLGPVDSEGTARVVPNPNNRQSSKIAAFVPSRLIPEPEVEGEVPSQNLHAMPSVDMLIVTADNFRAEALRLAEAHRSMQGLEVAVVTQDEVFNEFSSGAYHPNGLRRMVNMLASRQDRPLRHLLLMGMGQPRGLGRGQKLDPFRVVSVQSEYVDEDRYNSKNHTGDIYYGIIIDKHSERVTVPNIPVTVNVGRALLKTPAEASAFVDKCIDYLRDPMMAGRCDEAMVFGCLGDAYAHMDAALAVDSIFSVAHPLMTVHNGSEAMFEIKTLASGRLSSDAAKAYISCRMPGNLGFVNYSGHSTHNALFSDRLKLSWFKSATSFNTLPIFFLAGCDTGPIDHDSESWGSCFNAMRHGPIAVIASSREVYMNCNHVLNNQFVRALSTATPGITIGDIYTAALNNSHAMTTTAAVRDQVVNNFCFNFLGDPALPVRAPSATAAISIVRGMSLPTLSDRSLPALVPVEIGGVIKSPDGSVDTSFDGVITLTIYKPARLYTPASPESTDKAAGHKPVQVDDNQCGEFTAAVKGGRWTVTAIPALPDTIAPNRINLYAVSTDGRIATGGSTSFTITDAKGDAPAIGDSDAPEIIVWLDNPAMADGGITGSSPLLHVELSDAASGVLMDRSSISRMPRITLDGVEIKGAAYSLRPDASGASVLNRRLADLTDGFHEIAVTATDNAGNTAVRTLSFQVESAGLTATLAVDAELVRDAVEFAMESNHADTRATRLVIRDAAGNTVHSVADPMLPYAWDLRTSAGTPVADGTYTASLLVTSFLNYSSTPEVKFTVVKKSK